MSAVQARSFFERRVHDAALAVGSSFQSLLPPRRWLTRTVLAISLSSFFSDACYEGIIPLMPMLVTVLGGGALALGLIEGIADALAAVFKLYGGVVADSSRRRRGWAAAGYVGVGLFMPAIGLATSVASIAVLRSFAWISRGFRIPIRNAMLADAGGTAVNRVFGFERAMDSAGAVAGPIIALILVAALHVSIQNAILVGVLPGILAAIMYFAVRDQRRTASPRTRLHVALAGLPSRFHRYLFASGLFGIGNFSATLLVLVATNLLVPRMGIAGAAALSTALYLIHNAAAAAFSYPAGMLADRFGSGRVLACGFALYVGAYVTLATAPESLVVIGIVFLLAGGGLALVEPMESAFATTLLPAARRGIGFGALAAVNGIGDLASSAGVGALWQVFGSRVAFLTAGIICALGLAALLLFVGVIQERISSAS